MSVCSLTLFPFVPLDSRAYPEIRTDFERSFETLRGLPTDIFLASHASWFGLHRKRREQLDEDGSVAPYVDPDGYGAFIDRAERSYRERASSK